ncbi:hypothetical protein [Ferruginibacter sp.]|uniref:hypothetical protein n=1 Tax=Ferruginibacter sp. TaxID=1940288 RepID=UPI0026589636|nr:hypothetical protein [Ferruginibacter sp.]
MTFLVELNQINPKQPEQKERDVSAIMVLCHAFKNTVNAFNIGAKSIKGNLVESMVQGAVAHDDR